MVFGAVDVAAPLSRFGRILGFETLISDPRGDYARSARFPEADVVRVGWPHEILEAYPPDARSAVVSLNHEPRFEDDLFHTLLAYPPPAYLGAIGKARRAQERRERAREAGVDLSALGLIHTPIGLDIGGKEPEYIALSIMSEIIAVLHGRSGRSMAESASHGSTEALPYVGATRG
jgi:xanthine dehydrogenase accessory factor